MGKSNSGFTFIVGALAGAAAGYWLNTTKGKLWRKQFEEDTEDIRNKAKDVAKDVGDAVEQKTSELSKSVEDIAKKAKETVNEVSNDLSKKAKETENFVVNKASELAKDESTGGPSPKEAIKEGLKKAKETLNSITGDLNKA